MRVGTVSHYPVSPWHRSIARNKRLQNFKAPEFKYGSQRVTIKEISKINKSKVLNEVSNEDKKEEEELTPGKWINQLFSEKVSYGQFIVGIQSTGYTQADAISIVDESIYQSERATDWAISNEYFGNISANSALISLLAGLTTNLIKNLDPDDALISPGIRRALSVIDTSAAASRGFIQYEKIYGGRMDDDRARNKYESEVYGNKVAGLFSDLAYVFETNINPVALVTLGLLAGDKTKESIRPILSLCNSLWWRVRMLAEIDQKFGTDLFTYLINKPLSLINIKSAISKVKEIKDSGCFTYDYVGKRLIELSGLDSEKHKLKDIFPELGKLLRVLFNEDKDLAKKSSENIGKLLGPIFGLYGFMAYGMGVPVKSILHWLDKESKFVNLIAKSGSASQQLSYIFRIYLPEYFDNKKQKPDEMTHEKLKLREEGNRLFYKQSTVCAANVLATMLQLIDAENSNTAMKVTKSITEEVADKGINYIFSDRRKLLGRKYRLDNPELYNIDGTAKIISDKVKIEEEKDLVAQAA